MTWFGKLKHWASYHYIHLLYCFILSVFGVFVIVRLCSLKPDRQLLIVLVDGFRWDYYDRYNESLPGFKAFLKDGVQVKYVEPIYPSLSLPSWTTIVTGVYPATHNVLGNYMIHRADSKTPEAIFDFKDNSSMNPLWWKSAEALWTTAARTDLQSYLFNFARCEIPIQTWKPKECTGYDHRRKDYDLEHQFNTVVDRFVDGYRLAMIQYDPVDLAGHEHGPDSKEVLTSLQTVDKAIQKLMDKLKLHKLEDKVNVVITSDHGMTSVLRADGTTYVKLQEYLENPTEDIYKVMDYGAGMMIATNKGKSEKVFRELSKMPGVDVYNKSNIPEMYHVKESLYFPDIWLMARPRYFIVGLEGDKQLPHDKKASSVEPMAGNHGYTNLTDMRTIFFARGPNFKKGIIHPSIGLVDEYQIFTHVLNMRPLGRDGRWKNVADMLEKY